MEEKINTKSASKYLWILLGFLSLSAAFYYGTKSKQLNKQLNDLEASKDKLVVKSERLALREVDQLLLDGKYDDALKRSGELDMNPEYEEDKELAFRMKIAERLSKSRKRESIAVENVVERTLVDTVERVIEKMILPADDKIDSLTFALEKANIQLDLMKKQLREKSKGAYLTFKTTKGTNLHYVGEVKDGKANGQGIAILDSGSRYNGEWKDNKRHGKGVFFWSDGEYYEGEYANDQRSGTGIYYWTNGEKYVGQWSADKRNGSGKFFNKKGKVKASGVWKDDKLEEVERR